MDDVNVIGNEECVQKHKLFCGWYKKN